MSVYRSDNIEDMKVAVKSILEQSYKNAHLFLYRDGVVPFELNQFLLELVENKNITLYESEENRGLAVGLNTLIDKVLSIDSYEYIARMDSDDVSRCERFHRQVEFLKANPLVDVCGTSCKEFGASFALDEKHLPESHEDLLDFSIVRCPFIHPTVMFRARVFESGVRYPTNTSFTEDMALWFELLSKGYRFSNIREVLLDYRLNENTIKRRKGFGKALSEVKVRLYHMVKLRRISIKSTLLILSRLAFHILPDSAMKFAYKKAR